MDIGRAYERVNWWRRILCHISKPTSYRINSPSGAVAKYCDKYVCLCVCVCVCPRGYLRNHTRDLYQIFVHVAYGRGSVLFRQGDEIPSGRGSFGGFLPHWQCIVQHSIWDPYRNGRIDRDVVGLARGTVCYVGVTIPEGRGNFGKNVCPTRLTPLWLIANWSVPCSGMHTIGADT